MSGQVVVDASLTLKWVVHENLSDAAHALAQTWTDLQIQPVAPFLWTAETSNGLFRMVTQGRITREPALALLAQLLDARVQLLQPPDLQARAIAIALELRQPAAYDAHYLALAEIVDCELWTADDRFYRAASSTFSRVRRLANFRPS